MTDPTSEPFLHDGWRIENGTSLTIEPTSEPTPPDGCMRITADEQGTWAIAGDEVATFGNYVSVLIECDVNFGTPTQAQRLRTVCNLVLDGSAVKPLIETLAAADWGGEVSEPHDKWQQTLLPKKHSGPSKQYDWAVQNGASGRRPLELPPLDSGQSRLLITESEFGIVRHPHPLAVLRGRNGGWASVTALRPLWMAEDGVAVQLEEVNLLLGSPDRLIELLLHAGFPFADPHMAQANQVEPQEPPEANERGLIERVLDAIDSARDRGVLPPAPSGTGRGRQQDETPPPNTPVDADGSDRVIGIAELVDAVMELNHYTLSERRRDYLTERVEIIAMELGAVDSVVLSSLLSPTAFLDDGYGTSIPSRYFITLTVPGLEIPRGLAEPYWEVREKAASLDEAMRNLRDEILDLRREYLTNALLNIKPALAHRTTTEARLQARGLPSHP